MKRTVGHRVSFIAVALPALFALVVLASCAGSTASRRWAAARDALTTSQDAVAALHAAGIVGDGDLVAIDDATKIGKAALDVAYTQLPEGGQTFDAYMDTVHAALAQYARTQAARLAPEGGG